MNQHAPNACLPCSSHKRACDRLVPVCSRCARHGTSCQYERSTGYPQNFPAIRSTNQYGLQTNTDLDQLLTSRLFDTLAIIGIKASLEELTDAYLVSVHQWIPLIQSCNLKKQVSTLTSAPLAELSVFVLQLILVVPPSSFPRPSDHDVLHWLYKQCRETFSLLQAHRRDSLLTIQSGLVLAIFEQSQGLYSDAYVTLSICASLGYVMGLDFITHPTDNVSQEKKYVWQAIFFVDVLNNLSFDRCSRPELVQTSDTSKKPEMFGDPGSTNSHPTIRSPSSEGVCTFDHIDRQIQAVHVLRRVLRLTRNKAVSLEMLLDYKSWGLDFLIQQGIHEVLSAPQHHLERQYAVVVIFLLSTFELHKKILACLKSQHGPVEIRKISVAALETALNLIQDLLRVEEDTGCFDDKIMPITFVMLMEEAGSTAILLESEYSLNTDGVFQLALRALKCASSRWIAADKIALRLQNSRSQAMYSRAA
ncbi:Zn(2)-C6 fungal-type DNA-binding domain [Ilyonectria robusta]